MALYMCQVLHVVDFLVSRRMETAPTFIEVFLRQSDEPSDLRGSLSPTSVYSPWQSQAVTHLIMNRARRCLTSVIEHKPLSGRRIPYNNRPNAICHKINLFNLTRLSKLFSLQIRKGPILLLDHLAKNIMCIIISCGVPAISHPIHPGIRDRDP